MKVVGDILWHGEVNTFWIIIVPVYFHATLQATGTINIHRIIFSDKFYEMICMFFFSIFDYNIINSQFKRDQSPFFIPKASHVSAFLVSMWWKVIFRVIIFCFTILWWYLHAFTYLYIDLSIFKSFLVHIMLWFILGVVSAIFVGIHISKLVYLCTVFMSQHRNGAPFVDMVLLKIIFYIVMLAVLIPELPIKLMRFSSDTRLVEWGSYFWGLQFQTIWPYLTSFLLYFGIWSCARENMVLVSFTLSPTPCIRRPNSLVK